ncbi:hypothetical protein LPJ53_006344 [Coemansia erecta]|uniref:Aldehyde dehydrogenase domain-containing protein n=1 Tax=Coemansia erecta TaxID=147472 RepID=A0A9W8CPD9_9FUNG|nr:hypothetical protein LPJ53_006344 [Coemansia erecta]
MKQLALSMIRTPSCVAGAGIGVHSLATKAGDTTKLFINGKFVKSQTSEWINVRNPATQYVVTQVPKSMQKELDELAHRAELVFKSWQHMSILMWQHKMLDL